MADNGTNEELTKGTNEALLQRSLIIFIFCFSAKMPTFKKNKNLKGKFTSSQIDIAVKDVLNRGMGIREPVECTIFTMSLCVDTCLKQSSRI